MEYIEIRTDEGVGRRLKKVFSAKGPVIVNVRVKYEDEPEYLRTRKKVYWNSLSFEEKLKASMRIRNRRKENDAK